MGDDVEKSIGLDRLPEGRLGYVQQINCGEELSERLKAMGLLRGTAVECVAMPWQGRPGAYLAKGALIALRAADCEKIAVREELGGAWD